MIKPNSEFFLSFNDKMMKESFKPKLDVEKRFSDVLVMISVYLRSQATGQFTATKLVQLSETSYVLFITSNGHLLDMIVPEDSDDEVNCDPPPTSENAIYQKMDRIRFIESSEGGPIISFEYVSWETALEICCQP